ncbi:hypothetical protein GGR07_001216 [Bacteroides pyogenes]|nr:hypothetical protein [Bacteroides pyogenes]
MRQKKKSPDKSCLAGKSKERITGYPNGIDE